MLATWDVEDALFGAIEIGLDRVAGTVTVRGRRIPEIVVRRSTAAAQPVAEHVPIGTRDPAALEMTVGGRAADLHPAPGRISRRSYRVLAHVDGSALLSAPCAPEHSRIVRSARPSRSQQMGIAERLDDGRVSITWHDEVTTVRGTVSAPTPTPAEAAVAYAMAAAFGTGARMMLPVLLDVLLIAPI